MRVGSDFSGVGAFEQALKRLKIDYKTIFSCDIDKYARQTYLENNGEPGYFPEDVYDRDIPAESLDIYMTSPPCQAFSLAGKRKGEQDNRGVLFYNSHEFIKTNRPRYFIFENVKGLLSDDNGKTFQRWIDYLAKSVNGQPVIFPHEESVMYHVYHKVLNSKDFGVPQNRERIFIIGIRDDKDNYFRFPKKEYLAKKLKDVLQEDINEKYYLSEKTLAKIIWEESGTVIGHLKGFNKAYRICNTEKYALTIDTASGGGKTPLIKVKSNANIRRLTPRECFRLQDFDDSFTWTCSDSQAYKQAGNSITVGVLEKLLNKLINVNNLNRINLIY